MQPVVAVEIPLVGDERHKHWAKVVHSVDATKASGWAYVGDFIAAGGIQDVPAGSVVLVYGERGSRTNPQIEARVFTANPDGTLSQRGPPRGGPGREPCGTSSSGSSTATTPSPDHPISTSTRLPPWPRSWPGEAGA